VCSGSSELLRKEENFSTLLVIRSASWKATIDQYIIIVIIISNINGNPAATYLGSKRRKVYNLPSMPWFSKRSWRFLQLPLSYFLVCTCAFVSYDSSLETCLWNFLLVPVSSFQTGLSTFLGPFLSFSWANGKFSSSTRFCTHMGFFFSPPQQVGCVTMNVAICPF
jgi:hypothetical protein